MAGAGGPIFFNTINVNGMETNAAIFVGENSASGWDSNNKNQTAIGFTFGAYITYPYNLNYLLDSDFIDTTIWDNDIEAGPSTQV